MTYYGDVDAGACAWLRELLGAGLITEGEVHEQSVRDTRPEQFARFRRCHFFAGIGGWDLALRLAGWPATRPVWTGSCPCQPYSSAGKQKGDADERNLWPDFFRLIRECRPDTVFGEQVEGAIRHGWLDGISADLEAEGYAVGHCVLGAHSVGAPHIRQRLYWVADAGEQQGGKRHDVELQRGRQEEDEQTRVGGITGRLADGAKHGRRQGDSHQRGGDSGIRAEGSGGRSADDCESGGPPCDNCSAPPLRYYNIGFDDGYKCDACGKLHEVYGADGRRRDAGRLGDAVGEGPQGRGAGLRERPVDSAGGGPPAQAGGPCGVGNAPRERPHEHQPRVGAGEEPNAENAGAGPGFWDAFDLISCRDGKARRTQPGLFPLAHGIPGRVGLLRGAGNAIVPQVAALFVRAFLETQGG